MKFQVSWLVQSLHFVVVQFEVSSLRPLSRFKVWFSFACKLYRLDNRFDFEV